MWFKMRLIAGINGLIIGHLRPNWLFRFQKPQVRIRDNFVLTPFKVDIIKHTPDVSLKKKNQTYIGSSNGRNNNYFIFYFKSQFDQALSFNFY